jgi:O-antigen/teichoic acid export membrane protein
VRAFVSYLFLPFALVTGATFLFFAVVAFFSSDHPEVSKLVGFEATPERLLLVGALYAAQAFSNFGVGYLQGMQRFADLAKVYILTMIVQISIVLIASWYMGADGAILGYAVGIAIAAFVPLRAIGRSRDIPVDLRQRLHTFAAYSWASTLASAFIWARPEMAYLNFYWGAHAVGLYSVGFTLASLAIQGPMLLTGGFLPFFSEYSRSDRTEELQRMLRGGTRMLAIVTLPMCFGMAALIPELLPMLYGSAFSEGGLAAAILVCFAGIGATVSVPSAFVVGLERSDFAFLSNVSGAILSVGLGFLLVPPYGIIGAAVARGVVQLFLVALTFWFVKRRLGYSLPILELLGMLVAAIGCALVVRLVLSSMHEIPGMLVAIPAGALAYFVLIKLLRALPMSDVEHLESLFGRLPSTIKGPLRRSLLLIATPRAP